jgi:hypothetical protein
MQLFQWILALGFGMFCSTAISLSIFSKKLNDSNNIGDSTSTFDDVCAGRVMFTHRSQYDSTSSKQGFFKSYGYQSYSNKGIKGNYSDLGEDDIPEDLPEVDIPLFKPLS